MPDFAALASDARRSPSQMHLDLLWGAMFSLPTWSFVPIPGAGGQFSPYVGVVGHQRWVMTFTDASLATTYAVAARIALPGSAPLLSLSPRAAAVHLPAMRQLGVIGVLVNPGPDAFFAPFENLHGMLDHFAPRPGAPPPPVGYAPTLPVGQHAKPAPPPPPPEPLPTLRLSRDALLALVQAAADDTARIPYAVAALRLEPQWYVIATKANASLPALEIWSDGRMAAQVYTDERTAETMQQLMSMVPGDKNPLIPMSPEAAIARFGQEDMVELVVFNPRGEQLLVPLAQLA